MLRNYFTIALRNIRKNGGYTLINVTGLSLGICATVVIYVLVSYHLSFDNFHHKKEQIYRIITEFHQEGVNYAKAVPQPLGKAFRNDFTFEEKTARIVRLNNSFVTVESRNDVKKFEEDARVAYTEPEFFEIFDFPVNEGTIQSLARPNTVVITSSLATKYFGKENALGKTIKVNNQEYFTVGGVIKNLPKNTDLSSEIFLSYSNLKAWNSWLASDSSWVGIYSGSECFTLLKKNVRPADVKREMAKISTKYYDKDEAKTFRFSLQPLHDIHFNTEMDGDISKRTLYTLSVIGIFLLVVACVNFVNLATAHSLKRAKEVGVRKVLGSNKSQIFWQFISETFVIVLLAMILSLLLSQAAVPMINRLLDIQMSLSAETGKLAAFLLLTFLIVVFLSGFYPGVIQSGWRPIQTLKGQVKSSGSAYSVRRMLVGLQFAIVQMLIIGVIVIAAQMHFASNADLGFKKEGIVLLNLPDQDKATFTALNNQLNQLPGVETVSFASASPVSNSNNTTGMRYDNRTEAETFDVNTKQVDHNYLSTYGIKLVAGRNLFPSDTVREFLVNEMLVRKLRLKSPQEIIGKQIYVNGDHWKGTVVGVVRDFYNYSFHSEIVPVCMMSDLGRYRTCSVRADAQSLSTLLPQFEKIWTKLYPDHIYSATFFDDNISRLYEKERQMLHLVELFAGIAIFIGCLGLYGLVSFLALQKTKEIGMRKVLGASVNSIIWLFGREFSILVVMSFVFAAPLAGWVMHQWLQNFAYHIPLNALIFLGSIGATLVLTALTVGYRSLKAANANPVKSLRTE